MKFIEEIVEEIANETTLFIVYFFLTLVKTFPSPYSNAKVNAGSQ